MSLNPRHIGKFEEIDYTPHYEDRLSCSPTLYFTTRLLNLLNWEYSWPMSDKNTIIYPNGIKLKLKSDILDNKNSRSYQEAIIYGKKGLDKIYILPQIFYSEQDKKTKELFSKIDEKDIPVEYGTVYSVSTNYPMLIGERDLIIISNKPDDRRSHYILDKNGKLTEIDFPDSLLNYSLINDPKKYTGKFYERYIRKYEKVSDDCFLVEFGEFTTQNYKYGLLKTDGSFVSNIFSHTSTSNNNENDYGIDYEIKDLGNNDFLVYKDKIYYIINFDTEKIMPISNLNPDFNIHHFIGKIDNLFVFKLSYSSLNPKTNQIDQERNKKFWNLGVIGIVDPEGNMKDFILNTEKNIFKSYIAKEQKKMYISFNDKFLLFDLKDFSKLEIAIPKGFETISLIDVTEEGHAIFHLDKYNEDNHHIGFYNINSGEVIITKFDEVYNPSGKSFLFKLKNSEKILRLIEPDNSEINTNGNNEEQKNRIESTSEEKLDIQNNQPKSSISFFNVIVGNADNLLKYDYINIFGKKFVLENLFGIEHSFIKREDNEIVIIGLDNIEFIFTQQKIGNTGVNIVNLEIKNIPNNLTKKQRHYLQSVFYSFKILGFNIKYLDDNFSSLVEKNYILGHKCSAGDVCSLITDLKDNFSEDKEKIKNGIEILEEYNNQEVNQDEVFIKIQEEIISIELKNLINFKLALEHIIFSRNEILKEQNQEIEDIVLQNALKNSVLIGDYFESDKIYNIEKLTTDASLVGSFQILEMPQGRLKDLINVLEILKNEQNNKKKLKYLKKLIETSDDIFDDAGKIAKAKGIFSKLNPKNWFGTTKQLEESTEIKQLTKQEEMNEAMDVMVKLLNKFQNYTSNLQTEQAMLEEIKESYPDNKILQNIWIELLKIKGTLPFTEEEQERLIDINSQDGLSDCNSDILFVNFEERCLEFIIENYNDLEKVFDRYEEMMKVLYLQDYDFEKLESTNQYLKPIYKKGEFIFDNKINFEDFAKRFFEEVKEKFGQEYQKKENSRGLSQFDIIEKHKNELKNGNEINNIFDIKIGNNIFPIYIINDTTDSQNLTDIDIYYNKNKTLFLGTNIKNDLDITKELLIVLNRVYMIVLEEWVSLKDNPIGFDPELQKNIWKCIEIMGTYNENGEIIHHYSL